MDSHPKFWPPSVVYGSDPLNLGWRGASWLLQLESTLQAVRDIDYAQIELILLRCCLGYPTMGYTIRICVPSNISMQLKLFDGLLSSRLESIYSLPLVPRGTGSGFDEAVRDFCSRCSRTSLQFHSSGHMSARPAAQRRMKKLATFQKQEYDKLNLMCAKLLTSEQLWSS